MVITNKSQTQAQTPDGVLCSTSISVSGVVIIKTLRLFSYPGPSVKLGNPEIGLYIVCTLLGNYTQDNIFIMCFLIINF